jgi:hypothetical protein
MPVQPLNGLVLILARLLGITDFRGEPKKNLWDGPAQKKKKNRFFRIFLLKKLFLLFFYELKTS